MNCVAVVESPFYTGGNKPTVQVQLLPATQKLEVEMNLLIIFVMLAGFFFSYALGDIRKGLSKIISLLESIANRLDDINRK